MGELSTEWPDIPSIMSSQTISDVFTTYASFGTRQASTELDGAKFVKLFKDCGIVGKSLSSTEIDIIFSKVRFISDRSHLTGARSYCST